MLTHHAVKKPNKENGNRQYKPIRFGQYDREKALLVLKNIIPVGTSGLRPYRTARKLVCGRLNMNKQEFIELMRVLSEDEKIVFSRRGIKILEDSYDQ
jgi:hypothetical protein